MRLTLLFLIVLFIMAGSVPAYAQEWIGKDWVIYVSKLDGFRIAFPSRPQIQETSWSSEYRNRLPARLYSYTEGPDRFSIMAVDYTDIQRIDTARVHACVVTGGEGDTCQVEWPKDVQGSVIHAIWTFMERGGKITNFSWYWVNQVASHRMQIQNPDGGYTLASFHQHGTKLYITEATVGPGKPVPVQFREPLLFTDDEGVPVSYGSFYTNGYEGPWRFPSPQPPARRQDSNDEYADSFGLKVEVLN
jgi:hypothetical protein